MQQQQQQQQKVKRSKTADKSRTKNVQQKGEEEINALKKNTNKIAIKIKWWSLSVLALLYPMSEQL